MDDLDALRTFKFDLPGTFPFKNQKGLLNVILYLFNQGEKSFDIYNFVDDIDAFRTFKCDLPWAIPFKNQKGLWKVFLYSFNQNKF